MQNIKSQLRSLSPRSLFPAGLKRKRTIAALAAFGATFLLAASQADAFNAPAAGTFAFDIYDIGINQILKGPIGFAAGVGSMVAAAVMAIRQTVARLPRIPAETRRVISSANVTYRYHI